MTRLPDSGFGLCKITLLLALASILPLTSCTPAPSSLLTVSDAKGSGEYLYSSQRGTTYIATPLIRARPVSYSKIGAFAVVEGDIILAGIVEAEFTRKAVEAGGEGVSSKGIGIAGKGLLWPGCIVYYQVDDNLGEAKRQIVNSAILHWQTNSIVKFQQRRQETNYVAFVKGDGCSSPVGMRGRRQTIVVGPECGVGNIIHEIGHTVGLWHEQSRADRDTKVTIVETNILPQAMPDFVQRIYYHDGTDILGYDYSSIMHYASNAFASNTNYPTIIAPQPVGQRVGLSAGDKQSVIELYR